MRSATTGFFSTFASTKSLMRHRSSQRLKNVAASLYGPGPCDTVKAVPPQVGGGNQGLYPLPPDSSGAEVQFEQMSEVLGGRQRLCSCYPDVVPAQLEGGQP